MEQKKKRTVAYGPVSGLRGVKPDGAAADEAVENADRAVADAGGSNVPGFTVNLLWFSVLADHRGRRSEQISLPQGARGSDLIDLLAKEMPVIAKYREYIRLAVNQAYVNGDTLLKDGDEVALITPVSGG
ncbi:MoaD/ThiS family protein [Natronogracilivirga saccharolytica]|uniref:Molybdopterin synthase sulfur carrier subunit n=1 Tax=Natronogracilivirga saccharolytica TaxID=2812953 RepID=A0A8J7RL50_9BACT|nr:MoaD/ThiS family protein [Natronogracilivirga saccharolytica]MBP3193312.1 MoaD/ThiS family protein [Natronogracilivirga saccharolytica]